MCVAAISIYDLEINVFIKKSPSFIGHTIIFSRNELLKYKTCLA